MVIESIHAGKTADVYDRFQKQGRLLPNGLHYIDSWLEQSGERCFQLMQTNNPALFEEWINAWSDLVDFEIIEIGPKPVQ